MAPIERLRERLHVRRFLPRSLHLSVAVTEGSWIENLNKTVVRVWTTSSPARGGAAQRIWAIGTAWIGTNVR